MADFLNLLTGQFIHFLAAFAGYSPSFVVGPCFCAVVNLQRVCMMRKSQAVRAERRQLQMPR